LRMAQRYQVSPAKRSLDAVSKVERTFFAIRLLPNFSGTEKASKM